MSLLFLSENENNKKRTQETRKETDSSAIHELRLDYETMAKVM